MVQKPTKKWVLTIAFLIAVAACSTSSTDSETATFRDEFITAENQARIMEEARRGLSYEEFQERLKEYSPFDSPRRVATMGVRLSGVGQGDQRASS